VGRERGSIQEYEDVRRLRISHDDLDRLGRRRHGPGHRPKNLQQRHQLVERQPADAWLSIAEIAKAHGKSPASSPPCNGATPRRPDSEGPQHQPQEPRRDCQRDARRRLARRNHGRRQSRFRQRRPPLPASAKRDYQWVGGKDTWTALKQGKRGWKLIESKAAFEALTSGPTPAKVVGTAQVANATQEWRGRPMAAGKADAAGSLAPHLRFPSIKTFLRCRR